MPPDTETLKEETGPFIGIEKKPVAFLLHQRPHSLPLCAQDDGQMDVQIQIIDEIPRFPRCPVNPDPFLSEGVNRIRDIDDSDNGKMGRCTGGRLNHGRL